MIIGRRLLVESCKLLKGDTIQIFNYGNCKRDFTYVDDIVEGVKRVMQCAPEKVNGEDGLLIPPYRVYSMPNRMACQAVLPSKFRFMLCHPTHNIQGTAWLMQNIQGKNRLVNSPLKCNKNNSYI